MYGAARYNAARFNLAAIVKEQSLSCGRDNAGMDQLNYWQQRARLGRRAFLRSGGAAAATGAAFLAGCGSKGGAGSSSSASPANAGGQPEKGGVISHWLNTGSLLARRPSDQHLYSGLAGMPLL